MKIRTAVMFGVAFICASIAAFLVRGILARQVPSQVAIERLEAPARLIVVAAKDLKPGEVLSANSVREISWSAEALPKGAFLSKDDLLRGGEGRTVATFVAENEPIVPGKLSDGLQSTLSGRMKEGMTGVTIHVNDATGVGGFAQPEDHVNVLMTQTNRDGNSGGRAFTVLLLRNIRVLAVDQQTQRKTQAQPPKTVTLEATPDDAKKLALASAIGQLSLALTTGVAAQDDGGVIDINDLLQHQAEPQLPVVTPAAVEIDPIVTIVRSTERKDYKVSGETRH